MVAFDARIKEPPFPNGKPVSFVFAANGASPRLPRSPPGLARCRSDRRPGRAGARLAAPAAARFSTSIITIGITEGFEANAPNTAPAAADVTATRIAPKLISAARSLSLAQTLIQDIAAADTAGVASVESSNTMPCTQT
jgi:hypothetical protein